LLVLLDATILTNFAQVGFSAVLKELWGDQVCTTAEVLSEYEAGTKTAGLPPLSWKELSILVLIPDEQSLASNLFSRLGLRERTCLAVAIRRGALLATDDKPAGRAAKRNSIPVIGTLGILRRCVERGLFSHSEAQILLEDMIAAGYYSPIRSLKDE